MIKQNKIISDANSDYNSLYNQILKYQKKIRTKSYFCLTMEVFNSIFSSLYDPKTCQNSTYKFKAIIISDFAFSIINIDR
jgi:hypothetical protein